MLVQPLPFPASVSGGGGASPDYDTAEQLGEITTAAASVAGASYTLTPKANRDYLFLWSQDVRSDTTLSAAGSDVTIDGTSIFIEKPNVGPASTSPADYLSQGGLFRVQGGASPTAMDIALSGTRGSNAANLSLRNSRVSYVILGADDYYAENLPRQSFSDPANKTLTPVATLSFTPATPGDYFILCSFDYDLTHATNVDWEAQLTDGTTTTGGAWWRPSISGSSDRAPGMLVLPLSAVSGAKTITLSIIQPNTGGTTIGISEIRMVALRADRFARAYITQSTSNSSGSDTSYVTALSQNITPPAQADHLTIAAWAQASTNTGAAIYAQYLDGADTVNEMIRECRYGAGNGLAGMSHRIANYASAPLTQAIQRKANFATSNIIQSPSTILTLDLTGI